MPGFLGSVYIFIQYLCPNASLLPQLSHLNMGEPCLLKGTEVLMERHSMIWCFYRIRCKTRIKENIISSTLRGRIESIHEDAP